VRLLRHRIGSQQLRNGRGLPRRPLPAPGIDVPVRSKTGRAGTVAVVRPDGATQTVQVTLGQYPGWALFGSPFPRRRTA
jgi:hypothetical protein